MLQIVTGMYFRDVPRRDTTHRAAFYSNAWMLSPEAVSLPIGSLSFSTGPRSVAAVMIEAVERQEAVDPSGEPAILVATTGTELLDDIADVLAFALDVTCIRSEATLEHLVRTQNDGTSTRMPSRILRQTFEPSVLIREQDFVGVGSLVDALLALRRDCFEAAMRSVRAVIDATLMVGDDPALAYTLFVASLESLSQASERRQSGQTWDFYDGRKRKVFDSAIAEADLSPDQARIVRDAVLQVDQLSLRRRFIEFTLEHVGPDYYRQSAADAIRPIRERDLPHALALAYDFRSRNVHALEALAPEMWAVADGADTMRWEDRSALSLEGMNRLCRHVITTFIQKGPKEIDLTFDYRSQLPGVVRMPLAPQYWIGQPEGLTVSRAPKILEGFIELILATIAHPSDVQIVDLTAVLERIEAVLPGVAAVADRRAMAAIYVLWHHLMSVEQHRPRASELVPRFANDLLDASVEGFAVRLLVSDEIEWTTAELEELVDQRREELTRGKGQPVPSRLDAALILLAAQRLWDIDRIAESTEQLADAVTTVPGDQQLIELEEAARGGARPQVDLLDFVVGGR